MCPVTFTALAVSAGVTSATTAAVIGTAASGALIGMGANAVMNVATGQSITSGMGKAALFGAIGGGISGGISPGSFYGGGATGSLGTFSSTIQAANPLLSSLAPSWTGIALSGAAGSLLGAMTPGTPEYSNAYQQQQQQYNSQPSTVTGSGGKQAAFSLAESVRRAKKRKLTQEDVSELSIDTSSFASEGLQFA